MREKYFNSLEAHINFGLLTSSTTNSDLGVIKCFASLVVIIFKFLFTFPIASLVAGSISLSSIIKKVRFFSFRDIKEKPAIAAKASKSILE